MLDDWYRTLRLPMTVEQYHQLPRNPAYKYEYIDGQTWLTPRPKTFSALLDLTPRLVGDGVVHGDKTDVRPVADEDWPLLPRLFAAAFHQVPPFIALNDADRVQASGECLQQTRAGGDGPLLTSASLVAVDAAKRQLLGAILVTLIPKRDEGQPWDGDWPEAPATESARLLLGRPHLTWVFVAPMYARHGLGSSLLDRSVNALLESGYGDLATTFLLGNESTMLWHWRNGFRVLPHPWSMRGR